MSIVSHGAGFPLIIFSVIGAWTFTNCSNLSLKAFHDKLKSLLENKKFQSVKDNSRRKAFSS